MSAGGSGVDHVQRQRLRAATSAAPGELEARLRDTRDSEAASAMENLRLDSEEAEKGLSALTATRLVGSHELRRLMKELGLKAAVEAATLRETGVGLNGRPPKVPEGGSESGSEGDGAGEGEGDDDDDSDDEEATPLEEVGSIVDAQRELNWLRQHAPAVFAPRFKEYLQRRDLKAWFRFMDADGSGEISVDELEDPLTSMGLATSRRQVEDLIASVDEDGSGEIGFEEFLAIVTQGSNNPIRRLYESLENGELGDPCLHLAVLVAAYRRHVIMRACAALVKPRERKSADDLQAISALVALDTLFRAQRAAEYRRLERQEERERARGAKEREAAAAEAVAEEMQASRAASRAASVAGGLSRPVSAVFTVVGDASDGGGGVLSPRSMLMRMAPDDERASTALLLELAAAPAGDARRRHLLAPVAPDMRHASGAIDTLHRTARALRRQEAARARHALRSTLRMEDFDVFARRGGVKPAAAVIHSGMPATVAMSRSAPPTKDAPPRLNITRELEKKLAASGAHSPPQRAATTAPRTASTRRSRRATTPAPGTGAHRSGVSPRPQGNYVRVKIHTRRSMRMARARRARGADDDAATDASSYVTAYTLSPRSTAHGTPTNADGRAGPEGVEGGGSAAVGGGPLFASQVTSIGSIESVGSGGYGGASGSPAAHRRGGRGRKRARGKGPALSTASRRRASVEVVLHDEGSALPRLVSVPIVPDVGDRATLSSAASAPLPEVGSMLGSPSAMRGGSFGGGAALQRGAPATADAVRRLGKVPNTEGSLRALRDPVFRPRKEFLLGSPAERARVRRQVLERASLEGASTSDLRPRFSPVDDARQQQHLHLLGLRGARALSRELRGTPDAAPWTKMAAGAGDGRWGFADPPPPEPTSGGLARELAERAAAAPPMV